MFNLSTSHHFTFLPFSASDSFLFLLKAIWTVALWNSPPQRDWSLWQKSSRTGTAMPWHVTDSDRCDSNGAVNVFKLSYISWTPIVSSCACYLHWIIPLILLFGFCTSFPVFLWLSSASFVCFWSGRAVWNSSLELARNVKDLQVGAVIALEALWHRQHWQHRQHLYPTSAATSVTWTHDTSRWADNADSTKSALSANLIWTASTARSTVIFVAHVLPVQKSRASHALTSVRFSWGKSSLTWSSDVVLTGAWSRVESSYNCK